MNEDLGMLFIPDLNVLCKIYKDSKGLYVVLPTDRKHKAYIEPADK
jgi:hypothetical protein